MGKKDEIVFLRSQMGRIKITDIALSKMLDFCQMNIGSTEAGGILLGRFIQHSNDIVIDDITIPQPLDKRQRFFFFRSRQPHQTIVDRKWFDSIKTCNYLGEWHTHPEDFPMPSTVDTKNWKSILQKAVYDSDSLFFIIIGKKEVSAWEGIKKNLSVNKLSKEGDDNAI